ncbi:MAG: AAC(3) family N-acetyltransferase [Flavobacteriaceae bacterium]|nr:AAC(3) family N-acetyltransferase [Flavobacteriaceae bacterium]
MNLFYTKDKTPINEQEIFKILDNLKVWDTNYLYIHTGMTFGMPNPDLSKKQILERLLSIFEKFNIQNICFPTFTFSFCNGENFDLINSKSKMGSINEYARKLPHAIRSIDPLMSNVLIGPDIDLVTNLSKKSVGEGSTFDKLHKRDGVKFLFFGTKVGDCFTYMHYIEKMVNVNYRYDRKFTGLINDGLNSFTDTYNLFVRYKNIFPGNGSYKYEGMLLEKGISKRVSIGETSITILDEVEAYSLYVDIITKNPNYFLNSKSIHDFDKTFEIKNMIAL